MQMKTRHIAAESPRFIELASDDNQCIQPITAYLDSIGINPQSAECNKIRRALAKLLAIASKANDFSLKADKNSVELRISTYAALQESTRGISDRICHLNSVLDKIGVMTNWVESTSTTTTILECNLEISDANKFRDFIFHVQ